MISLILTAGAVLAAILLLGRQFIWWYFGIGRALAALEELAELQRVSKLQLDQRLRRHG